MDPAAGDEQSVARVQDDLPALGHRVPEEDVPLLPRQRPLLIELQVLICRGDEPEYLTNKTMI